MHRFINAAIAAIALALPALSLSAAAQERFTASVTGPEDAPAVILIPGLTSPASVWDKTIAQLSATHRVHALQVRGFVGEPAAANAEGAVLQPLIAEIAAYAEALDQPAIVGHSVGGLIGIEVAAAKPDQIGRVLVVDALSFYTLIFVPDATSETAAPYATMARTQMLGMTENQFRETQAQTMGIMTKTEAARPTLLDWSLTSDRRVVAQVMSEVMVTDARPRLSAITAPVTVLYAYDPAMGRPAEAVDQMYASAYAGLTAGNLKRIDASYHFIQIDQPEAFATEVNAFLN
jgi:pimeloyl-ACP methyl ester carboxylesterase